MADKDDPKKLRETAEWARQHGNDTAADKLEAIAKWSEKQQKQDEDNNT